MQFARQFRRDGAHLEDHRSWFRRAKDASLVEVHRLNSGIVRKARKNDIRMGHEFRNRWCDFDAFFPDFLSRPFATVPSLDFPAAGIQALRETASHKSEADKSEMGIALIKPC